MDSQSNNNKTITDHVATLIVANLGDELKVNMGNILKICASSDSVILAKQAENKRPRNRSVDRTSGDVTVSPVERSLDRTSDVTVPPQEMSVDRTSDVTVPPLDKSIDWTSGDVTVPSEFISSLNDTATSIRSSSFDVNEESTLIDEESRVASSVQEEKPKKTVQFDENIYRHKRMEFLKKYIFEKQNQEESSLCKAINEGSSYSLKKIKHLIYSGEDVNFRDNQGNPVLYTALFYEQYDVVTLLLEHGADVNVRNNKWDPIIYIAIQSNKQHIAEQILVAGADVNSRNSKGDPILYTAILSKQKEMVRLLLTHKADVNIRNALGTSCLEEAMTSGQMDIMEVLIEAGADIDIKDKEGNHLLHVAMMFKQIDFLRLLLNYGADVNVTDKEGNPVLEMALLMKNATAVNLLLEHGADVNLKNEKGIPVFYKAVYNTGWDIMKLMIDCGADVNAQDNLGNSVLFKAVDRNNADAIKLLLDSGTDSNIKNNEGQTCLEYALTCKATKPKVIDILIGSGTILNTDYKDLNSKTEKIAAAPVDDFVTFCDRALFMTSSHSEHHIRQCSLQAMPDKYWFCKVNVICDHKHIDCIIDRRLQLAYETLQKITLRQDDKHVGATIKDAENIEDIHPFEAEDPRAITEFELLMTTKNKLSDGIDVNKVTHEGNSMLHLAVKYKHGCLLRFLLHNGGNPYKRNRKSLSPLNMAFKINEKSLVIPMSAYILRNFANSNLSYSKENERIWSGWKCACKRGAKPQRELCSVDFVIVVETNNFKMATNIYFKGICVVCVSYDNNIIQAVELDAIQSKVDTIFAEGGFTPEINMPKLDNLKQLFTNHGNLKFVCPAFVRSIDFSRDNNNHEIRSERCIRLICRFKGIIPIRDAHFPLEIDEIPTDCVEDGRDVCVERAKKTLQINIVSGNYIYY